MFIRAILFFVVISLFSCAGMQRHPTSSKVAYGGAFGLDQSSASLLPVASVDTPLVNKVQADSMKKALRDSLKYFPLVVDSVIDDSLQNGADKEYAAAARRMEKYRKYLKNLPKYELIYGLSTAPFVALLIIYLASMMLLAPAIIQVLLLIAMGAVFTAWIWGFAFIAFFPYFYFKSAMNRILRAPKKAPSNRRIEYEVRTLIMLQKYLSKRYIKKKIKYIRQLGQTDPYNPWLEKLNYLEQVELKSSKIKGMDVLKIVLGIYVLRLLVTLLISII
jgi:hypothetical protein